MKLGRLLTLACKDLFQLLFPEVCCACTRILYKGEQALCTLCLYDLPYTDHHRYADNKTARKLWGRIPFGAAMAFLHFRKAGPVQEIIHHIKYQNREDLGFILGKMMGEKLLSSPLYSDIDLVIPVPLHQRKERQRGYNQSLCISKGIAEVLAVPVLQHGLIRTVSTGSQTRKSRYKRYENMKDVFCVNKSEVLEGKVVLLVDDVITTGATLESCAITLMDAKVKGLSIAALAFAD